MTNLVYKIIFLVFTFYVLINLISDGIYEIKNEKNKYGGIIVITCTILSVILSNVIVWMR